MCPFPESMNYTLSLSEFCVHVPSVAAAWHCWSGVGAGAPLTLARNPGAPRERASAPGQRRAQRIAAPAARSSAATRWYTVADWCAAAVVALEEEEERDLIKDRKRHGRLAVAWDRHGSPVPRWTLPLWPGQYIVLTNRFCIQCGNDSQPAAAGEGVLLSPPWGRLVQSRSRSRKIDQR